MSSPSKKSSPAIDAKLQKPIKTEVDADSGTAEANGTLGRKTARKLKMNESESESPVQSQSSGESSGLTLVGRSGRVRKAKVVFDPSDMEVGLKRKSWSVVETETKPKKVARSSDVKVEVVTPKQTTPEAAKKIDYRRKTVGTSVVAAATDGENGCIVCTRSDVRKGRFVVCINCPTRGHFTCLRNARFLSSAPEEKHWQCTECLRCAQCNETKQSGNLFKCNLCFMSFHLECMQKRTGAVTKKKFKCDDCLAVELGAGNEEIAEKEVEEVEEVESVAPPKKAPGNGFAGFSQEETNKSGSSSRSSSSGCSSDTRAEQQSQPAPGRKSSLLLHRSTSSKSSSKSVTYGDQSPPLFETTDIKIESEVQPPTPDPATDLNELRRAKACAITAARYKRIEDERAADEMQPPTPDPATDLNALSAAAVGARMAAKRKRIEDKCVADDIKYDRQTRIQPHESIPDVKKWDCDEVYTYFMGTTTAEYAHLFRENQIDGDALLLIKREDVLNRFNLKLGPALRLYSHIVTLQYKNNNPILAWDED